MALHSGYRSWDPQCTALPFKVLLIANIEAGLGSRLQHTLPWSLLVSPLEQPVDGQPAPCALTSNHEDTSLGH